MNSENLLLPVAPDYALEIFVIKPGERLHRLMARLADTYYDDLSIDRIEKLEELVDTWRLTHADGSRISRDTA